MTFLGHGHPTSSGARPLTNLGRSDVRVFWVYGLAGLYFFLIYIPYVLHGGFVNDDWWVVHYGLDGPNFFSALSNYYPHTAGRPLIGPLWTALVRTFGSNPTPYILVNVLSWGAAIFLISNVVRAAVNDTAALVFFMLAITPSVCSSVIFYPATMVVGSISLLFWSLSFTYLYKSISENREFFYYAHVVALTISVLIYEGILPLFTFSALFPISFFVYKGKSATFYIFFLLKYAIPPGIAVMFLAIWQKIIAPTIFSNVGSSRVTIPSYFYDWYNTLINYFLAIFTEIPDILISSTNRGNPYVSFAIFIITILLFWRLYRVSNEKSTPHCQQPFSKIKYLVLFVAISIVFSSVLFLLSSHYTVISATGYWNRLLFGFFVLFCLLCAFIFSLLPMSKILNATLFTIVVLNAKSFVIQRDNFIESWRIQTIILTDLEHSINTYAKGRRIFILASLPRFVHENFNDEIVFNSGLYKQNPGDLWDLWHAMKVRGMDFTIDAKTVTSDEANSGAVSLTENYVMFTGGYHKFEGENGGDEVRMPLEHLWFYRFREDPRSSEFFKITDSRHLRDTLESLSTTSPSLMDTRRSSLIKHYIEQHIYPLL